MVSSGRLHERALERKPKRSAKRRILIVAEGTNTEPGYFNALKHDVRNPVVHVEVVGAGAVPLTVVERAIEEREEAERRAMAERDVNEKYDHAWAVFDVDQHPHLLQAKERAARAGIECAISNPCFELWALLHFQEQRASIDRHKVSSVLRQHLPGYLKDLDYARMKPGYQNACARAAELDRQAELAGDLDRNPTTGVRRLTELIRTAS